jgi:hypothetical protein
MPTTVTPSRRVVTRFSQPASFITPVLAGRSLRPPGRSALCTGSQQFVTKAPAADQPVVAQPDAASWGSIGPNRRRVKPSRVKPSKVKLSSVKPGKAKPSRVSAEYDESEHDDPGKINPGKLDLGKINPAIPTTSAES